MVLRPVGAALAALSLASAATAQSEYDAFVIAGQSNAVGSSTQNEELLEGRVTSFELDPLAAWSFRQSDHLWTLANEFPCADSQCVGTNCSYPSPNRTTAVHPQWSDQGSGTCVCSCGIHVRASNSGADAGRGSAWPTFARSWREQRQRAVRFVSTAIGAQCLVGVPDPKQPGWDPDAMDCSTLPPVPLGSPIPSLSTPGELYCRMLEAVQLSGVENLRGVLWMQGECDASAGVPSALYKDALLHLGDAIWQDLGVPLIVAPISRHTLPDACSEHPRLDDIHSATLEAAAEHPHILLGPLSDDLALEPDCTHVHDVVSLGERWFDAVEDVLPACNDGLDNDGDGLVDAVEDVGCSNGAGLREDPACQDGIDNDGDGRIDFDGGAAANGGTPLGEPDTECRSPARAERPGCGLGAEIALASALLLRLRRRFSSLRV